MNYLVIPVQISRRGDASPALGFERETITMGTLSDAKQEAGWRATHNERHSVDSWAVYREGADLYDTQPEWCA